MTVVHAGPFDFKDARIEGVQRIPFEKGLFGGAGSIESQRIETPPFDDLVGSFNARVPKTAEVELDVQVFAGAWSNWYRLVAWSGDSGGRSFGRQEDALGFVDVDTLKLKQKATALRYRVLMTGTGSRVPALSRVALTFLDTQIPPKPKPFEPGPWVREIALKPRSQQEEQEKYKHDICSPTSLAMVLERWGARLKTVDAAELVLDHSESKQFGNWPLNVQGAATLGLSGQVSRLNGLDEIQEEIAQAARSSPR